MCVFGCWESFLAFFFFFFGGDGKGVCGKPHFWLQIGGSVLQLSKIVRTISCRSTDQTKLSLKLSKIEGSCSLIRVVKGVSSAPPYHFLAQVLRFVLEIAFDRRVCRVVVFLILRDGVLVCTSFGA